MLSLSSFNTNTKKWMLLSYVYVNDVFLFNYSSFFQRNLRYIAVHNPLDYKKAINDASALKHRLVKYLLPVMIASFIFNIPKLFEATYFVVEKQVGYYSSFLNIQLYTNIVCLCQLVIYSFWVLINKILRNVMGFLQTYFLVEEKRSI